MNFNWSTTNAFSAPLELGGTNASGDFSQKNGCGRSLAPHSSCSITVTFSPTDLGLREAGAKEVHLRSASPPLKWPDYYGIDMPDREKLLAANHSVDEIARILNVDSMGYLSVDGLYWAMGPERDAKLPQYTDHYFTGDYPTRLLDREIAEGRNELVERQLSFLVDA